MENELVEAVNPENENRNEGQDAPSTENENRKEVQDAKPFENENQERIRSHLRTLVKNAQEISADFPDADLSALFCDRRFFVLTSPLVGFDPLQAYMALNPKAAREKIMRYTAAKCAENYAAALQSGGMRPVENGLSSLAATPKASLPETKEERAALRERIRRAAVFGKKIFPN